MVVDTDAHHMYATACLVDTSDEEQRDVVALVWFLPAQIIRPLWRFNICDVGWKSIYGGTSSIRA
eukprot:scaffold49551_cov15-Prasinocladus_malaysianus.AAC.1